MSFKEDIYTGLRNHMVSDQLIAGGIKDNRVLLGMARIPRHCFVPPDQIFLAYEDRPVPIGEGQTISQPFIVAYMTQKLELTGTERVLEIGTGSGYQTALLSLLAKEVYSVELHPNLAASAKKRLDELEITNYHIRIGDGYEGWLENAPYDAILITAAPPLLPMALVEQLAIGGKMIAPVGVEMQDLWLVEKLSDGLHRNKLIPVIFVPMVPKTDYNHIT